MPQRGDEVVHQPQLGRLPVDVGRHKQEAGLGTEDGVRRQQVLAGAALWTQHRGGGGEEEGEKEVEEEDRAEQRGDGVHDGSAETQRNPDFPLEIQSLLSLCQFSSISFN